MFRGQPCLCSSCLETHAQNYQLLEFAEIQVLAVCTLGDVLVFQNFHVFCH